MMVGNALLALLTLGLLICSAAIIIELRLDAARCDAASGMGEGTPRPRRGQSLRGRKGHAASG